MNPETEVERILRADGARLVRHKKHLCWRLSNGLTWTQAATPSDRCSAANQLSDLRRALGIADTDRGAPGERRESKHHHGRHTERAIHPAGQYTGSFAEKLRVAGVVEQKLRETAAWQSEVIDQLHRALSDSLDQIQAARERRCWWCRLKRRAARFVARWRHEWIFRAWASQ